MVDRPKLREVGPFEGPGKYDEETTWVRERTSAELVVVLVANGIKGSGFSAQIQMPPDNEDAARMFLATAVSLRAAADDMERSAMRVAGKGARARARLLLSAAALSLEVLSTGLRGVANTLSVEEAFAVGEADGLMVRAAEALTRALRRPPPAAKGSA